MASYLGKGIGTSNAATLPGRFVALGLTIAVTLPWPGAHASAENAAAADLPPVECVQMLRKARGLLEVNDREGGARLLRKAAERFPGEVVALAALWDYDRQFGLPEDEATELRKTFTERLANPESPLPPGVLQYLIGNPDANEEELMLLLTAANARLNDGDVEMLRVIASIQLRLELYEDARATYARLLELAPSESLNWRCVLLDLELERWADAAAGLKSIATQDGASFISRLVYVDVLSRLGRSEEMLGQIERLASENPLMADMINGILSDAAWNLRDAGEDEAAEAVFRRILAADPEHPQALAATLYLYGTEDELQAHLAELEAARDEESDSHALLEQGGNLLAAGDAEQALGLLQRASRGLPESEIAWFNLGLAALKLERWDTAEQAFFQATRINPGRADSLLNRASALQRLGRCEEAIDALDRTLELAPDKNQAYYYLHFCHLELGNDEAAREALRLYNAARSP